MNKIKHYIWINITAVTLFVILVPTIIVMGFGHSLPISLAKSNVKNLTNSSDLQNSVHQDLSSKPINLGWVSGTNNRLSQYSSYNGLNVLSPALLTINDGFDLNVNSENLPSINKQDIWPRVVMKTDTKPAIHTFLTNQTKVDQLISDLRKSTLLHKWSGINLDIENVDAKDRDNFSNFIQKLSRALHSSNILLSIDISPDHTGTENLNTPFDHEILGIFCDYVIFMGYDQHWSTDPIPGPVTSLDWLTSNLQEMIRTGIPSQKIILGLPTFTRIWQLDSNGNIVNDPAYSNSHVESLLKQKHVPTTWDSNLGEYTSSFVENNKRNKVWLTTTKSLKLYLSLIPQMHLGGSAFWNLNLISKNDWNQLF
jgi:spore germination protein YaaH